jgi:hypothetical protein
MLGGARGCGATAFYRGKDGKRQVQPPEQNATLRHSITAELCGSGSRL